MMINDSLLFLVGFLMGFVHSQFIQSTIEFYKKKEEVEEEFKELIEEKDVKDKKIDGWFY